VDDIVAGSLQGLGAEAARARVARGGWGRRILALQAADGRWGGGNRRARTGTRLLLDAGLFRDDGINLWQRWIKNSETCVTGMVLRLTGRFAGGDGRMERLAGHLLEQQMADGGWNCQRPRGATHSSLHTTISVLEGLLEYEEAGGERAHEFLYRHRMFRSHRTGQVIDGRMTRFSFPPQWHYDVLRGLDYLRAAGASRDPRVSEAIELVKQRRRADGTWLLQSVHRGGGITS
jgi:hypothetical protein